MNKHISSVATENQNFISKQVDLFMFDLKNEAAEHGLKANESWIIEMASVNDVAVLKRPHHPVVSVKLQPEALLKVYQNVKGKLLQSLNATDESLTVADLINSNKKYLSAYPVRSVRK